MAETSADVKEFVKGLMEKKEAIEKEIQEFLDVLESQGNVGMEGPLVDVDQFPRSDINLYTVRHARNRIICLRNDLKDLMKLIEENLESYFQLVKAEGDGDGGTDVMSVDEDGNAISAAAQQRQRLTQTFAKVDHVSAESPAQQAGLVVGDELVRFGSINPTNFIDMNTIGRLVQNSVGKSIPVDVVRGASGSGSDDDPVLHHLTLTPHAWSGRGLLGCNMVPINKPDR